MIEIILLLPWEKHKLPISTIRHEIVAVNLDILKESSLNIVHETVVCNSISDFMCDIGIVLCKYIIEMALKKVWKVHIPTLSMLFSLVCMY